MTRVSKTISERCHNKEQSWFYERIEKVDQSRLRVSIRRNAYDDQSYVRGYVFDPGNIKWNLIVDLPFQSAACKRVNYTDEYITIGDFAPDAENVLTELLAILYCLEPRDAKDVDIHALLAELKRLMARVEEIDSLVNPLVTHG